MCSRLINITSIYNVRCCDAVFIDDDQSEPEQVKDFYIANSSPTHDHGFPAGGIPRAAHPERNMPSTGKINI